MLLLQQTRLFRRDVLSFLLLFEHFSRTVVPAKSFSVVTQV
jgi:hypothetical protein